MNNIDHEGIEIVAKLMALAARTAPKTMGADLIHSQILTDEEKELIVHKMEELAEAKRNLLSQKDPRRGEAAWIDWRSDAKAVAKSDLLMLIGIQGRKVPNLNCGGCGFPTCAEMIKAKPLSVIEKDFGGPYCMFRIMDLSIALGSAVKIAMDLNVDNRMMQKVGIAVLKLGLMKPCDLVIGLPLSASGKNIYFDRLDKIEAWKILGAKTE